MQIEADRVTEQIVARLEQIVRELRILNEREERREQDEERASAAFRNRYAQL